MDKQTKVEYWLEISQYDLETARVMLSSKRYLYVGFMCHQAIEKILKAYYSKTFDELPPYIHNLRRLANLSDLYNQMSEQQIELLETLEPLNIDSRYPDYKKRIYQTLNEEKCKNLLKETEVLFKWIKAQL